MMATEKNRRSSRIAAKHNIMLMVEAEEGNRPAKEVVTTMHISKHGAHLVGRRALLENSKGRVANLSTCKQASFRIAWQAPSRTKPGYHEMGIEFEEPLDFWGTSFDGGEPSTKAEPAPLDAGTMGEPPTSRPQRPTLEAEAETATCGTILDQLRLLHSSADGREISDAIWCGLVEQLEERRVISRGELIASLRKVGLQL